MFLGGTTETGLSALCARLRDAEILADLLSEVVVELTMPRNGRALSLGAVDEHGMFATFAE